MSEHQAYPGSTYRVKFIREAFVELVRIAQPKIIYHVGRMYFFSFDGFAVYTMDCTSGDFAGRKIMDAIEFSNMPWHESK
jgi:hypothetical protein